ncbi:SAM hydrolase/SAM-dependent halogenase family protein [Fontivita pretiosa]|uniref:SAM hydrolase/SAM-dependent halogenase family protein n=1 Tax=Fontivita pretiosa TaxID=2989684 RepID=UPI003D174749
MPAARRPIVTLTSDFGLSDYYVAAMKAVLLRNCPRACLIDITHLIPRHDILYGSITLERAIDSFLPGTVHLAVIDPGVGTDRRILIVQINRQLVVCPDNGLITWAWRLHAQASRSSRAQAYELTWRPKRSSSTFHGRDVMAPVAGKLACGTSIDSLARPIDDPILLDIAPADPAQRRGRIIHIDVFGNATTNIPHDALRTIDVKNIKVKGRRIGGLKRTYGDVPPGRPLALIGSSGLLEIAVRDANAARQLKLRVGDEVVLE